MSNETTLPYVSCLYAESTTKKDKKVLFNGWGILEDYWNLPFILVGKGEKGKECGEIIPYKVCDNPDCGKLHWIKHKCRRKGCPDCYKGWIKREVDVAYARLMSKESLIRHKDKRLAHLVLSPSREKKVGSRNELRKLFDEGYDYIKSKGAEGGVCVFHAFRAKTEAKIQARREGISHWNWIREQENVEEWYYLSPHFHLISFIGHLKEPEEGEEWIYKQIADKDGKYNGFLHKAKRDKEIRGLLWYLLTHAVTIKGGEDTFHSIRWWGSCSYNKFITTEEEIEASKPIEKEELCKICRSKLVSLSSWYHRWFEAADYGDIDKPKFWDELLWLYGFGDGIEPSEKEREEFVVS